MVLQARKGEEQRAQRLAAELNQYRHDMERTLSIKEEELESIKYKLSCNMSLLRYLPCI